MANSHQSANGIAFVNGTYVPLAEATITLIDRSFLLSDVTYDRVYAWWKFFRLDDRIECLLASMRGMRMSLDLSGSEITVILTECVRRSGLRDAYAQMICTRDIAIKGTRGLRLYQNRLYTFA